MHSLDVCVPHTWCEHMNEKGTRETFYKWSMLNLWIKTKDGALTRIQAKIFFVTNTKLLNMQKNIHTLVHVIVRDGDFGSIWFSSGFKARNIHSIAIIILLVLTSVFMSGLILGNSWIFPKKIFLAIRYVFKFSKLSSWVPCFHFDYYCRNPNHCRGTTV